MNVNIIKKIENLSLLGMIDGILEEYGYCLGINFNFFFIKIIKKKLKIL